MVRFRRPLAAVAIMMSWPASAQAVRPGPVVVAAASLKGALDAIATAWASKGGAPAILVYDPPASTYGPPLSLRARVAADISADVIISDDAKAMDALAKAGLIVPQTRRAIIGDDLVLIVPADAALTLKIASGFDLARAVGDGRLALCAPAACAAGVAARQSLERLKAWSAVEPKLVETSDAHATLVAVERGEARFGIVLAAEAKADAKVKVLDVFPISTYEPFNYAVALAKASRNTDAASFIAFLRSGQATRLLSGFGFAVLR